MTSALKINERKGHRAFVTKIINEVRTPVTADEINEEKLFSFPQSLTEKLQTLSVLDDLGNIRRRGCYYNKDR